jgi:hypothetical protein
MQWAAIFPAHPNAKKMANDGIQYMLEPAQAGCHHEILESTMQCTIAGVLVRPWYLQDGEQ